jgi:hypothetical protein
MAPARRPVSVEPEEMIEEPSPASGRAPEAKPAKTTAEIEASVAHSARVSNADVTRAQIANERADIEAHPERVVGEAPNRKVNIGDEGEHEIRERPDGGCERRSDDPPLKVDCPRPMQGAPETPIPVKTPYEIGLERAEATINRLNNPAVSAKFQQLKLEFARMTDPRAQQFLRVIGDIELPPETLDNIFKSLEKVPRSELRKEFQNSVYEALADRAVEFPKQKEKIHVALSELHESQKKAGAKRILAAEKQVITLDRAPERTVRFKLSNLQPKTLESLNDLVRIRESETWRRAWLAKRQQPRFEKEVATSLVSEDLGVAASLDVLQTHFPQLTAHGMIPSPNQSGIFDSVYSFEFTDGNRRGTTWIIAEAKGGESPQPSFRKIKGKYYEQGTMPHTVDTIEAMKRRGDLIGSLLERALDPTSGDRVLFVKVTARVKPSWKGLEGLHGRSAPDISTFADENALNLELTRQLDAPLTPAELESAMEDVVVNIWDLTP